MRMRMWGRETVERREKGWGLGLVMTDDLCVCVCVGANKAFLINAYKTIPNLHVLIPRGCLAGSSRTPRTTA